MLHLPNCIGISLALILSRSRVFAIVLNVFETLWNYHIIVLFFPNMVSTLHPAVAYAGFFSRGGGGGGVSGHYILSPFLGQPWAYFFSFLFYNKK